MKGDACHMKIQYKYLPMGSAVVAHPNQKEQNEGRRQIPLEKHHFYLDTGGSHSDQVFDHHDGSKGYLSTTQMVFDQFEEKIKKRIETEGWDEVTLVSHYDLHLDTAGSLYYITRKLERVPLDEKQWEEIVEVITDNNQGYSQIPINNSIPTYFKAIREVYLNESQARVDRSSYLPFSLEQDCLLQKVFRFFDDILALLKEEPIAIYMVCQRLKGQNYRLAQNQIRSAELHYKEDLRRSRQMAVKIPLQQKTNRKEHKLVDGVIFYNPTSFLFKEFARSDTYTPSLKNGYTLMIVHWGTEDEYQHVISVDPVSECSLEGLGALLENKERLVERAPEARKRKNRKDRICAEPDNHGDVMSHEPWTERYSCTIIFAPHSGSLLTDAEVNELVWEYGNPCKGVELESAKLTLFIPFLADSGIVPEGMISETGGRQGEGYNDDILPAVGAYFSQAKKAEVRSIDIPQKGIDEIKNALFSETHLEQCDAQSELETCQKACTCTGSTLHSFLATGDFTGRIDFYCGEEARDFTPSRISFTYTYTGETPLSLNGYMCFQFDLVRRFRLISQANRLGDICASIPEIKGFRTGELTAHDVCHWGEYVFSPRAMSLSHLHDFQKTILVQLINTWPQTFEMVSQRRALQRNETLTSGDGQKLMSFNEQGGGVVVITGKTKKSLEEKRIMRGYTTVDYFADHAMLVSLFSFTCFQRRVIAHFMKKVDGWLQRHSAGSFEEPDTSDELSGLTGVLLKKEHGVLSDQITYSKAGNDLFFRIRKRLYVDALKDRFESDVLKLNNYLLLRSSKDIAEKTNKLLREAELSEKKEKRIALFLEITILPYYLYHIGEFLFAFLRYAMHDKERLESVTHLCSFIFAVIITAPVVYLTVGRKRDRPKTKNMERINRVDAEN